MDISFILKIVDHDENTTLWFKHFSFEPYVDYFRMKMISNEKNKSLQMTFLFFPFVKIMVFNEVLQNHSTVE
jgi:hypothetical protein